MKIIIVFGFLGMLLLLAGCASVHVNTTAYYRPSYQPSGTIAVVAADPKVEGSLQFSNFKTQVENRLSAVGYTVVDSPANASSIALLSYGVEHGKGELISSTIVGQSGFATTSSNAITNYNRVIEIDIVDAKTLNTANRKELYQIQAVSVGCSPTIAAVFPAMIEGMFDGFPGQSGRTRYTRIRASGQC